MKILADFSKIKVLVVGDLMVDRYWWGSVSRISPEAPVPVVQLQKKSFAAGGAANVAANIAGLGAEALLVGIVGADEEGIHLRKALNEMNVSPDYLIESISRPTTVKTRIIAHNQQVVRLDQEVNSEISETDEEEIWKQIKVLLNRADVVIVSDYAKGVLTVNLLSRLISECREQNIKILVDPKGVNYEKYKGATLITPNLREAAEACKMPFGAAKLVESAGRALLDNLDLEAVLITEGENGMTLFGQNGDSIHFDALARNVYDVTGAGDTVIATFAVAFGAGRGLSEAAELANIAAGLVVEKIGTTPIDTQELQTALDEMTNTHSV